MPVMDPLHYSLDHLHGYALYPLVKDLQPSMVQPMVTTSPPLDWKALLFYLCYIYYFGLSSLLIYIIPFSDLQSAWIEKQYISTLLN